MHCSCFLWRCIRGTSLLTITECQGFKFEISDILNSLCVERENGRETILGLRSLTRKTVSRERVCLSFPRAMCRRASCTPFVDTAYTRHNAKKLVELDLYLLVLVVPKIIQNLQSLIAIVLYLCRVGGALSHVVRHFLEESPACTTPILCLLLENDNLGEAYKALAISNKRYGKNYNPMWK